MSKRYRILPILLSTALAITTLDGCNVNVNIISEETEKNENEPEESDEQITRGIPEETSGSGDLSASDNGEEEEIEIPAEVIEELFAGIEENDAGKEKKGDPEANREMDDIEVNYTMDDVAGYWIYENFNEIYLALYDSGQYETYDKESGEVISTGSYEVDDNEVVITEGDEEPQILEVVSMMTLMDDEGDLLTRFNPDGGPVIIAGDDEAKEEDADSRLYGIHPTDDVVTEDLGNGWACISSKSRQVKLTYPKQYRSGVVFDDTLYVYDGDGAYVTARNLTGEFNVWKGSNKSFKEAVADTFIPQDFTQFYGKRKDAANIKRNFLVEEQSANCKSIMTTSCNMWNKKYDIQCNQTLLLLTFSDGAQQLVLLSMYHRWDNKKSRNNVVNVRAGALKNI